MTQLQILKQHKLAELKTLFPQTRVFDYQANFKDKTEKDLKACIQYYAKVHGFQAEVINNRGFRKDNRVVVENCIGQMKTIGSVQWLPSSQRKGTADMSLTIRGRSVKCEIKMPGDRMSQHQKEYQNEVEQAGGIYWIVTSFEDFYNKYQNFVYLTP